MLRDFSLNENKVEDISKLRHMSDSLEEFCIGGNERLLLSPIIHFTKIKKLFLEKLNLKSFDPLWFKDLSCLTKLSLAHNLI